MQGKYNKRIVTLTLTNKCNLSCVYCYEIGKENREMSFEIAKNIIDKEMQEQNDEEIEFDLFGGEPFLHFDLIKKIYNYLVGNYPNCKWFLFATTNGTLIHGEIQEWIENRKRFYCGLSLDGTKLMHDLNRSNSYDKIDIDFFKRLFPKQPVKMTVSTLTLPYLSKGVISLHKLGFEVDCNLAYGIDWSNKENKNILEKELMILIDYYLKNPNIKPCKMLNYNIASIAACYQQMPKEVLKWCGTKTSMHTYDVDGKKYPCQFFMPLSIGKEKAKKSQKISFLEKIPIKNLDKKCRVCPYVMACPTCYGSNYCSTGSLYSKDNNYCLLTKIQIEATTYLKAKQWEQKLLKLTKDEENNLLKSILIVQNIIKERK